MWMKYWVDPTRTRLRDNPLLRNRLRNTSWGTGWGIPSVEGQVEGYPLLKDRLRDTPCWGTGGGIPPEAQVEGYPLLRDRLRDPLLRHWLRDTPCWETGWGISPGEGQVEECPLLSGRLRDIPSWWAGWGISPADGQVEGSPAEGPPPHPAEEKVEGSIPSPPPLSLEGRAGRDDRSCYMNWILFIRGQGDFIFSPVLLTLSWSRIIPHACVYYHHLFGDIPHSLPFEIMSALHNIV